MQDGKSNRGPVGFKLIGGFKVACAILFAGVGVGLFRLLGHDVGDVLHHAAATLRLGAGSPFVDNLIAKASGVSPGRLQTLGVVTFLYAALYLVEGVGLILNRRWAGYLTVVATGSLVPLEAYEIYRKPTALRITILVVNLAMVAYVAWKLREEIRAEKAGQLEGAAPALSHRS